MKEEVEEVCFQPSYESKSLLQFVKDKGDIPEHLLDDLEKNALFKTIDRHQEIYALLPFEQNSKNQLIVIYEKGAYLIDRTVSFTIRKFVKETLGFDWDLYNKALKRVFKSDIREIPIATTNFSLISFGKQKKCTTSWINPRQIVRIEEKSASDLTAISLSNGVSLKINCYTPCIYHKMQRAFLIQGIMKREDELEEINPLTYLSDYLDIQSTPATKNVLDFQRCEDIPGEFGEFTRYYRNLKRKKARAKKKRQDKSL